MPGGLLTKQRTSRCLRRTQRFHLFMVSLQDWLRMICNEQPSSTCFFLWLNSPCLWQTPYMLFTSSEPSDYCPQILGACKRCPPPWNQSSLSSSKRNRTAAKVGGKQQPGDWTGLKVPGSTQKDQRMLCRGVRTWLPKYCIYLSFCLGLIDFLLTYFGFWLYILFSKWNPQWIHLWVFFMSNSTSLVTKLEKDIWGNCKVFHPGKFCGKHLQLTNFCLVW